MSFREVLYTYANEHMSLTVPLNEIKKTPFSVLL